ncbi:PAS domain-containing protein [Sulfurimonas sp. SAG-AH-194-L11]|nr:ATP-binding protein [Sulfurimonas sp. SAG-AH-194-L11]MDF1877564.1 PAS domain-containing protein [Sulfurimonas sp. SAG-AH-194-L11]
MLMELWNKKYNFELVELLTKNVQLGIVVVHIAAPLAMVYILFGYIQHSILLIWLCIHFLFFFLRVLVNRQLIKFLKQKSEKIYLYLKVMYVLSFISTFLYGFIIWISILHNIPDTHILLIGFIMSGLAAGSLTTLGSVFSAYIVYMIPSFLFLISALVYHGGDVFEIYALAMFTVMGIFYISGHRYYKALHNAVSLDTTFKTIYKNSSDGIVIFQEHKFVSLNKAMNNMFKYEDEEAFLALSLRQLSPMYQPDGSSSLKRMVQMVRATFKEGYKAFEWLHKDKNREEFWCEIVLTKINLNGTDLIYGVWRNISDRKDAELQMLQDKEKIESLNETLEAKVDKALKDNREKDEHILHQSRLAQMGEMISMIAHQWRQPLTAIASAGALINLKAQLGKLDKETAMEVSQDIANYTQHLSATINDFRDFFKEDKEKEITSFTYLVNSVLTIIRTTLENNNIRIIEELDCKDGFMAYSNELKQVIINLVKNAQDILVDKNIQNPYIKLKSYVENENYVLEVSDNGGGVPEEIMDKIFNPYFSTKLKKDGTGLGLYMSKTIVEEHSRGRLSCYNTQDGASFKIELPNA